MQTFQTFVPSLVFAVFVGVAAQLSDLSSCGQTCITNMLALAPSLGCSTSDATCICDNVNYGYGVRDCANEACGAAEASTVIAFAAEYCSSAIAGREDPTTTSQTGTLVTTTDAVGSSSAVTTSAVVSTVTSGSFIGVTTVGSTTIFGIGAADASASGIQKTETSVIPSSVTSGSSSTETPSKTFFQISTNTPTSVSSSVSQNSTPAGSSDSQSLSTGAEAGIGVGVAIGAIILAVLMYIAFLLQRHHRARSEIQQREGFLPELGPGLTPKMDGRSKPTELPTKRIIERSLRILCQVSFKDKQMTGAAIYRAARQTVFLKI